MSALASLNLARVANLVCPVSAKLVSMPTVNVTMQIPVRV